MTDTELDELRAKTLFVHDFRCSLPHLKDWPEGDEIMARIYRDRAVAIRKADERAGIVVLSG